MEAKTSLIGTDEEYKQLSDFYDRMSCSNVSINGKFEIEVGTVGGGVILSAIEKSMLRAVCESFEYDLINKTATLKLSEYDIRYFYQLMQKLVRMFEEFNLIYIPKDSSGNIQGWTIHFEKGTVLYHKSSNSLLSSDPIIHEFGFKFQNIIFTIYTNN